MTNHSC